MGKKLNNFTKRLFSNEEENFSLQVNAIAIFGGIVVIALVIFFIVLNSNSPVPLLPVSPNDTTSVVK